jgi:hypothetical protein
MGKGGRIPGKKLPFPRGIEQDIKGNLAVDAQIDVALQSFLVLIGQYQAQLERGNVPVQILLMAIKINPLRLPMLPEMPQNTVHLVAGFHADTPSKLEIS